MPFDPSLLTMLAIVVVGYFLLVRPSQRRAAEQQKTLAALSEGTRVMTTAGIFGTVRHSGDKQVVLEISPGVEMTVVKAAISKVVAADEDEFEYDEGASEAADVEETAEVPGDTPNDSATEAAKPASTESN